MSKTDFRKKYLNFPETKIGRIYATKNPAKNVAQWEYHIAAKGRVKISSDYYFRLDVGDEFSQLATEFLRTLKNDDVQEIQLFGKGFGNDALFSLKHLTKTRGFMFLLTSINEIHEFGWADFQELEKLIFVFAEFDCKGLEALTTLSKLKILYLDASRITNDCLPLLESFTLLEKLSVRLCKISNEGFSTLAKLTTLKNLDISGTSINDAGLRYFSAANHLQKLYVEDSWVTENGVRELQKCLPDCEINNVPR